MVAARPIVVQKFGGTSVGSVPRIHHVATLAMAAQRSGYDVVVVVSAMSGETDRLLNLANEVSDVSDRRERDVLAAAGEQASAALTAIAIQAAGGKARSFMGHQIPILTDSNFGDAHIMSVEAKALRDSLARGEIPVVAGFQGIDADGNVTTLGRGGSDTTAVVVAAALGAETCDIYTDVDGVYTADPNIVPSARKLAQVDYQHMLTFAALGAKVLHDRCVEQAKRHGVRVQVRTSFGDTPGTIISGEGAAKGASVGGLALDRKLVQVYMNAAFGPAAFKAMTALTAAIRYKGVTVCDIFSQDEFMTIIVRPVDLAAVRAILRSGEYPLVCVEDITRVSLVGSGLAKESRIKLKATNLVSGLGIKIKQLTVTESSISLFVAPDDANEVMRILHDGMAIGVGREHGEKPPTAKGRRR